MHEFASPVFEDICREFVRELQKKNALPFRYTKMGRWTGKRLSATKRGRTDSGRRKLRSTCLLSEKTPGSIWWANVNLKKVRSPIPNI